MSVLICTKTPVRKAAAVSLVLSLYINNVIFYKFAFVTNAQGVLCVGKNPC